MRAPIVTLAAAAALVAAAAPAAAIVHTLQAEAHGQCHDADGNGGGADVFVFPIQAQVDAVDPAEARSLADGLAVFAQGTAADAGDGSPGDDDACSQPDDDADGSSDGDHTTEDHVSAQFYWLEGTVVVGVCYDNEGAHTTADCHSSGGGSGGYSGAEPHLP